MADNFTNSEIGRKLSDWISRDDSGRSFMYEWTTSNTAVDLPTAPGVTTPVPSLRMIVDPVAGAAGELANGVASVKLIANTVTGQITVANGKAQAASDSANTSASWAATSGNYSNVAGVRADTARVYMEQARDIANGVTITNAVVTNAALGVASNTTLVLTTKGQIDLLANAIGVMNTTVTANKQSVDLVNTSVWTAKGLIDTVNTNVNTSKTAAATSATNAGTANTNAWTARLQANSAAANAIAANTNVYVALGTTLTLLSQANTANAGAWQAKLATDNNVVTAGNYAAQAGVYASAINPANYVTISSLTWANTTGKPSLFPTDIANTVGLQAALDLKLATGSFTYSLLPGKPTYFPTDTANVSGLSTAMGLKLDTAAFTWSGLSGKPTTFTPASHTHAISEIVSLQATLDGKLATTGKAADSDKLDGIDSLGFMQITRGARSDQNAWLDGSGSFGVDTQVGAGLFNLVAGAYNEARDINSGSGNYKYIGTRGASRIAFADNAFNFFLGSKASGGGQVAGEIVTWLQPLGITTTAVNFYLPVTINGATPWTSANLAAPAVAGTSNTLAQRDASGNVFGNYIGTVGGLYHSAGMYFQPDTGASPVRWTVRSGNDTATGVNLSTNGTFRGALYADSGGNLGLLNSSNAWRLMTTSTGLAYINSDAGGSSQFWTTGNFDPATKASLSGATFTGAVNLPNGIWVSTADAKQRMHFVANSDSIWKSAGYHYWRKADDTTVMTLTDGGQLQLPYSNVRSSNTGGTGQFTAVSGSTMAGFYNDGSQFYILKHATSNTSFDGHRPLYVNLTSGTVTLDGTGAGGVGVGGSMTVAGTLTINSGSGGIAVNGTGGVSVNGGELWMGAGHWLRFANSDGAYWTTWGGGWHMSDATWMRCYGDKNILTGGTVQMGAFTVTSDRRLKTDIVPLSGAADILDRTNVYEFTKKGKRHYGVLAQEVREVAPILVSEGADLHPVDNDPILAVDLTGYIPLLIDEVKSMRARLASAGL